MTEAGIEVLDEQQCQLLLGSKDIGRIAFEVDGVPEIFPVNYAADGSAVVFRTAEGAKLQQAAMRRVAFEVDDWDATKGVGWSVVIKGVAEEITTGIDPFAMALRTRPVVPLAPGAREYWMAVYPSTITGRRFWL
jgi:nitroimidazol reductase NimA-like FMN-containing flavoprotein (pyridoxamine 5'-phosphate oxidase superfamily)